MNNGSTERMKMTAGMDLGDNYSRLCLIDTENGEIIEESRLRTTPEAIRRRFDSERSLRVVIEVGTHSPWVSRLLEECGHQLHYHDYRECALTLRLTWATTRPLNTAPFNKRKLLRRVL